MFNIRKLGIIWIKFLQPHGYTSKTLLSVKRECFRACGWSLVRLELELLVCSLQQGLCSHLGANPTSSIHVQLWFHEERCSLGRCPALGTLPAQGLPWPRAPAPCPAQPRSLPGLPGPHRGPEGSEGPARHSHGQRPPPGPLHRPQPPGGSVLLPSLLWSVP